jgi:hypothetical protein
MTVAFDAKTAVGSVFDPFNGNVTINHTASGANRFGVLAVWGWKDGAGAPYSGVTYGGSAMALMGEVQHNTTEAERRYVQLYGFVAPPTTSTAVVLVSSGLVSGLAFAVVASYTGVHQGGGSSSYGSQQSADTTSSGTQVSLNVGSVAGGLGIGCVFRGINSGSITTDGNGTIRQLGTVQEGFYDGALTEEVGGNNVFAQWTSAEYTAVAVALKAVATAVTLGYPFIGLGAGAGNGSVTFP